MKLYLRRFVNILHQLKFLLSQVRHSSQKLQWWVLKSFNVGLLPHIRDWIPLQRLRRCRTSWSSSSSFLKTKVAGVSTASRHQSQACNGRLRATSCHEHQIGSKRQHFMRRSERWQPKKRSHIDQKMGSQYEKPQNNLATKCRWPMLWWEWLGSDVKA